MFENAYRNPKFVYGVNICITRTNLTSVYNKGSCTDFYWCLSVHEFCCLDDFITQPMDRCHQSVLSLTLNLLWDTPAGLVQMVAKGLLHWTLHAPWIGTTIMKVAFPAFLAIAFFASCTCRWVILKNIFANTDAQVSCVLCSMYNDIWLTFHIQRGTMLANIEFVDNRGFLTVCTLLFLNGTSRNSQVIVFWHNSVPTNSREIVVIVPWVCIDSLHVVVLEADSIRMMKCVAVCPGLLSYELFVHRYVGLIGSLAGSCCTSVLSRL